MSLRYAALIALAFALYGCEAPTFPTDAPVNKARYSTRDEGTPKPPPVPKGVANFEMDPQVRPRIVMIVAISAIAFIVALLISLAMRQVDRVIPAGIAAAFAGPAVALLIIARRMSAVLTGMASAPFFFADFSLAMWNENQPLLFGLYCGSLLLIILLIVAALTKRDAEPRGSATLVTLLIAIVSAAVSFVSFVSMDRLLLAMLDPITTDPLPQTLRHLTFGTTARMSQVRLITALAAAALTIIILLLTVIFAFTLRRIRGRVMIAIFALIVMLCTTLVDRTWSEVLETTARSGHVPETLLTR